MTPKLILLCYAIGYVATFVGTRFDRTFERTWLDVRIRAVGCTIWPAIVIAYAVRPLADWLAKHTPDFDTTNPPKWL